MNHPELHRRKQTLDALYKKVSALNSDLELQAHWARYLCVLTSGFIELAIRTLYAEYASRCAGPYVGNYVAKQLSTFQNAKMDKILLLAHQFNPSWATSLRDDTADDLKDAVDSIVSRRNEIAHGGSSGLSFHQLRDYYQRAIKVIELVEHQCL